MSKQTFVVAIDPRIARQLRLFLAAPESGYETISEFVEVAVMNQLSVECAEPSSGPASEVAKATSRLARPRTLQVSESAHGQADEKLTMLLSRPAASPPLETPELPVPAEPLSVFTNRLSPMKVAVRVAARLAESGAWPLLETFHRNSAESARMVALALRDREGGDPRRLIAYPIGADREKSLSRFVNSFTITSREGGPVGALALLGLATIYDGRVTLSKSGWRLAAAPSPLLDGSSGRTLSSPEALIFQECIAANKAERRLSLELLGGLSEGRSAQAAIDALLAERHRAWSKDMVVAHRAALVGRLADAELVEVQGRGATAELTLTGTGAAFLSQYESGSGKPAAR